MTNFVGDVNKVVAAGSRSITWRPSDSWPDGEWLLVDEHLAFCEAKAFMLK